MADDKPIEPVEYFSRPADKVTVETGLGFFPKFNSSDGTLPVVATDAGSGDVVMLAYMNAEALALTIETGIAHYWSRSRGELWQKGQSSGNIQRVQTMRTDCDQDAIWISVTVDGHGASCHMGYHSCFYRSVPVGRKFSKDSQLKLQSAARVFDPRDVYGR